jgi:two-component system chemotaxis response regulator CheY
MHDEAPTLPRRAAGAWLSRSTVLILDDDPTMRAAVRATLQDAGCQNILHTGNGNEALRLVDAARIDLILCDCQMPIMEGMTFLRKLRDSPAGATVPVIMLTASRSAADAWEAQRLNVAGWLVKPITPQSVAAQVAATLGNLTPRVSENLLESLVQTYEADVPAQVQEISDLAAQLDPQAPVYPARLQALHRRLHVVRGQAGTMGYALLGDLAGLLDDTLRLAREEERQLGQHQEELGRLVRVGTTGMKLVADRRLRGDGGAAGARMKEQLGDFAGKLRAKLSPPGPFGAPEAGDAA